MCDAQMYLDHKAKCREAYPATCPFTISGPFGTTIADPVKCPLWLIEKGECFNWASVYFVGVDLFGQSRYDYWQGQNCWLPK